MCKCMSDSKFGRDCGVGIMADMCMSVTVSMFIVDGGQSKRGDE